MNAGAEGLDLTRPELAKFVPVLDRLKEESAARLGVPEPRFTVERFMPRIYSEVLQLRVTAPSVSKRVFVKIARAGASAEAREGVGRQVLVAFETMDQLHRDMSALPGLSVAKPIACFPDHLTIVTEEAPGLTLLDLLNTRAAWWPRQPTLDSLCHSFGRIGEWLRRFQEVSALPNRMFSLTEMREYIDVRLKILVELPHSGLSLDDRERLLAAFDARASRLAHVSIPLAPVHADFALGNVIVNDGDIVVLDFTVPVVGAASHDAAHLYMQLDLLTAKPQFRTGVTRALQRALLNGFQPALEPDEPLFELLLFQHVVCHFVGLARSSGTPAVRLYNWHLQRRHRRWLSRFESR